MSHLEKQVNALMRLCTAEKEADRKKAQQELQQLLQDADPEIL